MKDAFRQYLQNLCDYLPEYVFEGLGIVFCIGVIMLLVFWGNQKRCEILI